MGFPEILSSPLDGPVMAFSALIGPDQLDIWLWSPSGIRMTETLTVDTWPGPTIERTVLISPDGAHVAIHEVDATTNSPVQRVRILTLGGRLIWTAPTLPIVTAMAWSADGGALAIGSLPVPWTVVKLGLGTEPAVTTYALDDQDGYGLLGFSADGTTLYGYGTGGEAEFWQKPVAVDRAKGTLTHLDAFPGGPGGIAVANTTTRTSQINAQTGDVLALVDAARGTPRWVVKNGPSEHPLEIDLSMGLTWSDASGIVGIAPAPGAGQGGRVAVWTGTPTAPLAVAATLPPDVPGTHVAGARDGYALLVLSVADAAPGNGVEAVLVELASGRFAVGLPPSGAPAGTTFEFAGWISPAG